MASSLYEKIHDFEEDELCPDSDNGLHQYVESNGFYTCLHCGLVGERIIETGHKSATRDFGKNITHKEIRNIQLIGPRTQMGQKKECQGREQKHLWWVNQQFMIGNEKNYLQAQDWVNKLRDSFPEDIIRDAWNIYLKCKKHELITGRSIEHFVATATYLSININKHPLLITDYLETIHDKGFFTTEHKINDYIGEIIKHDDIIPNFNIDLKTYIFPYMKKALENLIDKEEVIHPIIYEASFIAKYLDTSGKSIKGYLAGLTYERLLRHGMHVSQKKIAEEFQTTEITLRSRYREIKGVIKKLKSSE